MVNTRIGRTYEPSAEDKQSADLYRKFKKDPVGVFSAIVRNQHSQYNKEILTWKTARMEAENIWRPRRTTLYDLYDDIMLDGYIHGIIENKRKLKVANKPYRIVNADGDENKEATQLIRTKWFTDFIKSALDSRFYGHSLIYLNEFDAATRRFKSIETVYRKHVLPWANKWIKQEQDEEKDGIDYTQAPYLQYMIPVGDTDNLGLLNQAAPLYILKKHSWQSWDEFEEIFGIPIRVAKVASGDPKVRAEVAGWLKSMGSASYAMFPPEAELEITANSQTDSFNVFNMKRKAANEELEVLLMGVRNVSESSGTYGKQRAILEEQDEVEEDDKKFILNLVNDELLPRLRAHGYPIPDDNLFDWEDVDWGDPVEKMVIYQSLQAMGYKLDSQQISADLGVNILGEMTAEEMAVKKGVTPGSQGGSSLSGAEGKKDKGGKAKKPTQEPSTAPRKPTASGSDGRHPELVSGPAPSLLMDLYFNKHRN
jgi:hypothetical protein